MREKVLQHHRFYLPTEAVAEDGMVVFPLAESIHMVSSLRIKKGDVVSATDGKGRICKVLVEQPGKRRVVGRIGGVRKVRRLRPAIHVFQGIVKPSGMDLIVEKCTELGVSAIVPVRTERSMRRLSKQRLERLRRIAIETMKQALGAYLPEICEPVSFEAAIAKHPDFEMVVVAWEKERKRTLVDSARRHTQGKVAVWVGPEGGLTKHELEALTSRGALTFTLGGLRLKTDTAAIASVAILRNLSNCKT